MAAPVGNKFGTKARIWTAAIERALEAKSKREGIVAIDELATSLITLAQSGDLGALKELGDRLEGKSMQSVAVSGDADNPLSMNLAVKFIDK